MNDYRLMGKAIVEEKVKSVSFKGAAWGVEFEPSIAGVQKLKKQAQANSEEELDQQLTEYAELGIGEGFVVDDSLKPSRFDESGGFCTRLLSFVDENGRDMTFLEKGAF